MATMAESWPRMRRRGPAATRAGWVWWLLGVGTVAPAAVAVRLVPAHATVMAMVATLLVASAVLVVARPSWGACALITLIYWNASDVVTETWGFSWGLRLVLAGVLAAWFLLQTTAARPQPWRWPLAAPLTAYGLVLALASWHAVDRGAANLALYEFAKEVIALYLIANLLRSPRAWRRGVEALLAGVGLLALPVVYQGVTGSTNTLWGFGSMALKEITPGISSWRLGGAIGDPNFLALVLVAALPLALVQVLERGASRLRRWGCGLVLGLGLAAVVFTYSRDAIIGLVFIALATAWKYRRRRGTVLALGLGLALGVVLVPASYWARMATLGEATISGGQQAIGDASFRIRRNAYLTGLLMFEHHPWLGVGPGNYEANFLTYSAWVGLSSEDTVRDPHSLPIQVIAETGLAGAAVFVWLAWACVAEMEKARRRLAQLGAQCFSDLLWATEIALATYLILSLFLHAAFFRHFFLLLALGGLGAHLVLHPAPPACARETA